MSLIVNVNERMIYDYLNKMPNVRSILVEFDRDYKNIDHLIQQLVLLVSAPTNTHSTTVFMGMANRQNWRRFDEKTVKHVVRVLIQLMWDIL